MRAFGTSGGTQTSPGRGDTSRTRTATRSSSGSELNPDAYMPVYWGELLQAVEGYDDHVAMAYVRALAHNWHVCHCAGLRDDQEFLRRVCRQTPEAWATVGPIVFGEFFRLDRGAWRQKRQDEEWR